MMTKPSYLSTFLVCCTLVFVPNHAFFQKKSFAPRLSSATTTTSTVLYMSSSNRKANRARLEHLLEESMGNDWRLFRAQLIAQEQAEKAQETLSYSSLYPDENNSGNVRPEAFCDTMVSVVFPDQEKLAKDGSTLLQDPFVSPAEIPIHLQPKVRVDKHRWAHPISHVEPGCILIANEELEGVFQQTVVLVVDHDEISGTTGVIINRPQCTMYEYAERFENAPSVLDIASLKNSLPTAPVAFGGPYKPEIMTVLHGYGEVNGAKKLAPGVFIGGVDDLETEAIMHRLDPTDTMFLKGHGSWVPGQLYNEIELGVWYTASCSADFLLRYAGAPITEEDNYRDLWSDILTCMGGEYAEVAQKFGGYGDEPPQRH